MDHKLDPRVLQTLKAELRKEMEAESKAIAKPVLEGLMRWITTTSSWKLLAAIVATWPISILESFVMHELVGFFPSLGTIVDGIILGHLNEWLFYWLPIALSSELLRRAVGRVRSWRQTMEVRQIEQVTDAEVIAEP